MSIASAVEPLFLSLNEAARLLACGRTTIYGYVQSGDLHIAHHGRSSVVSLVELQRLADKISREAGITADSAVDAP